MKNMRNAEGRKFKRSQQGQVFGATVGGTTGFYNDNGTSYFVGVHANDTSPGMLLAGDHNMGDTGNPPNTAQTFGETAKWFVSTGTNGTAASWVGWADNQHSKQGNVAMADGSAQGFSRAALLTALQNTGDATRGLPVGFVSAANSQGVGANCLQFP